MVIVRVFWILLVWYYQLETHLCEEDCINNYYDACETKIINMTSDEGWKKLQRIIDQTKAIHIQKLVVPISPSGPFLQRIHTLFDAVMYLAYREPTFQIPDGNTIREILITRAVGLKSFIAGTNIHLEILDIQECTLDRLPQTLSKMVRMRELSITMCMLAGLRLDLFVETQNLTYLNLAYNRIQKIFPLPVRSGKTISIERITLTGNQLEYLDMTVFAPMSKLTALVIVENPLTHLGVTAPVTLPQLSDLYMFDNQLVSIDLRNATLPQLKSFAFSGNEMTQMPLLPKTLPKFDYFTLERNKLTRVDLSYFRPYQRLKHVHLSGNQINTVHASTPVRLPIDSLRLDRNKLTSLDLTGCDMPNITTLTLASNRISVVPPLFEQYPKVRMLMDGNPLPCNVLLPYKDKLESKRLEKDQQPIVWPCTTASSIQIGKKDQVCCDS